MRATMKEVESLLPRDRFVRIHRSILVNRAGIREIAATDSGDYLVRLQGGQTLSMSRRRKQAVHELLGPVRLDGE
jgi:two-component system LytT family response regulator